MYLKSIEVHGFKSFAHKLIFEFHDGITGIVGPNGSGKSNVADAVRWVLGEQSSKQLRGAKMQDVIFAGTENRRPLSYAYVAITLDNSDHKLATDFEEVTVARRLYRSGESEYLINGSSCRLKDVQELFFDTGIGKEGYSIIGQGQIDKILNGKPEERRELFDEAAGIVKFKKRKSEAEKDLQAEKNNLERVTDILFELEKQIGPLQKQSETAKVYLKLKDDLKALDLSVFVSEYENLQVDKKETEEKELIVTKDYEATKIQLEQVKVQYDSLEVMVDEYENTLDEKKNEQTSHRLRSEQLDGNIKVYEEQIISAKQNELYFQENLKRIDETITNTKEKEEHYLKEKHQIGRAHV